MNKTVWKSTVEINSILAEYNSIGIFSCGVCANLSFTGGKEGLRAAKNHVRKLGKKVPLSRVVLACCPEEIMSRAVRQNQRSLKKCDALVVLSCAAGIKSANSCRPSVPVINILDSVGSTAVACSDPVLARSLCSGCGHCVLTATAGICPVSECPAKKKYGPCGAQPERDTPCTVDRERECIWHIIEERNGDMELLKTLKLFHREDQAPAPLSRPVKQSTSFWKKFFAWHAARMEILEWVIKHFKSMKNL